MTGRPPALTIRQATLSDCQSILDCLDSAFAPFKSQYTTGAYADTVLSLSSLQQRLQQMTVFVVTFNSPEVIGTIACSTVVNGEGHLRGMAVLPSWQGRGISQRLLDHAESHLRESDCNRITLDTTEPLQRAITFYERNGFRATGRKVEFFGMPLYEYEKQL